MTKQTQSNLTLHQMLRQPGNILILWSVDDVQSLRPDLNDAQASKVLEECYRQPDPITWDVIEDIAFHIFPVVILSLPFESDFNLLRSPMMASTE